MSVSYKPMGIAFVCCMLYATVWSPVAVYALKMEPVLGAVMLFVAPVAVVAMTFGIMGHFTADENAAVEVQA